MPGLMMGLLDVSGGPESQLSPAMALRHVFSDCELVRVFAAVRIAINFPMTAQEAWFPFEHLAIDALPEASVPQLSADQASGTLSSRCLQIIQDLSNPADVPSESVLPAMRALLCLFLWSGISATLTVSFLIVDAVRVQVFNLWQSNALLFE